MDIIEQAREKIAEISSALRAVGLEPWGVNAYKRGDVSVCAETPNFYYPVIRIAAEGAISAEFNGDSLGEFATLADAAAAIATCVESGVLVRQDGDRWIARRCGGAWWGGATRDEAIAAALAVRA